VAAWFASIGGRVVALGVGGDATDVDGTYDRWFSAREVSWALQRPDFRLYGTASAAAGAGELLVALRQRLVGRVR
jgi:hypothetical protein